MEVEREVLPIVSQCLDCMEKSAESIDEKEVSANKNVTFYLYPEWQFSIQLLMISMH